MCPIRRLTDKTEILAFLETDRDYAAYAIGDLDAGFFERSSWYAAERSGVIETLALVYTGFDPPVLFLMGDGDGAAELLAELTHVERAYLTVRAEHLAALGQYYRWEENDLWPMWRMALSTFYLSPSTFHPPRLLTLSDIELVRALYALGGGDAFTPDQLAQGVFYGIEQGGQLIAAAGTHLVSTLYNVAAVGNVMTHLAYRGRGLATLATSAVCAELGRRGIATIVLNVSQANAAAVRVYDKLGFARHCAFYEGLVKRQ